MKVVDEHVALHCQLRSNAGASNATITPDNGMEVFGKFENLTSFAPSLHKKWHLMTDRLID